MGQDPHAAELNKEFFAENEAYAERVRKLETYRRIRIELDRQLSGVQRLLDVGNGGVFDYDTSQIPEIVAVDLFLEDLDPTRFPPNVVLRNGSALALPEKTRTFDGVLFAFLLHHLIGETAGSLVQNVRQAVDEAHRVLREGGRLIVAESFVPAWFYGLERALFRPTSTLVKVARMRHPVTMQLPIRLLRDLLAPGFEVETVEAVPPGALLLQFGHRWPAILTPARPYVLTARKLTA